MISGYRLKLSRDFVRDLPLAEASQQAARRGADFFPSRAGLNAARRSQAFVEALRRSLRTGYEPSPAEISLVPRSGGGTRPAADIRVSDRIVFDALMMRLREILPTDLVNSSLVGNERIRAEDALSEGPHGFVLVTDVVAFYEYVDRGRLSRELLELPGEDKLVHAISTVLTAIGAQSRGIPQGSPEATVLGDVYLSASDRELARSGFDVVRWGDDYRIPANTLKHAYQAAETLERALREIGLVVSGAKTWTPSTEKFRQWIADQRATRQMVRTLLERIQAAQAHDYAEDGEEDGLTTQVDEILEEGFLSATDEDAPWGSSPEGYAAARRVQVSLRELGRTGSDAPLSRLTTLLLRFPHLTRDISQYVRRRILGGHVEDTVRVCAQVLTEGQYPYEWQAGWLIHGLIPDPDPLPASVISACEDWIGRPQSPGFIRGRCAILLATEGRMSVDQLGAVWHEMPEANRDDLVAAATILDDAAVDRFLRAIRRDPLYAAIADEAPQTSIYQL